LLVVDGHAFAYRAFHAIRHLSAPDGAPTNAIYGFIQMLVRLQTQLQPRYWLVVWDGGLAAERRAAWPPYKAQRPPMPESLERQLDGLTRYLEAAGIASHCQAGVEADDWIATLARHATEAGLDVVIASSDKDFMQLVSQTVGLWNPNDKSGAIWMAREVRAKTGVEPAQMVDWLSLVGDSVDNIPGVVGVGPKTAANLLGEFGSLEGLLSRLPEVKPERLRANLEGATEVLRRNQRLIRLNTELPCRFCADELRPKPADAARLRGLYEQWGFQSLLRKLETAERPPGQQGAIRGLEEGENGGAQKESRTTGRRTATKAAKPEAEQGELF
jgi:DNA polymerase-1